MIALSRDPALWWDPRGIVFTVQYLLSPLYRVSTSQNRVSPPIPPSALHTSIGCGSPFLQGEKIVSFHQLGGGGIDRMQLGLRGLRYRNAFGGRGEALAWSMQQYAPTHSGGQYFRSIYGTHSTIEYSASCVAYSLYFVQTVTPL